jgi:hypothetical protein
MVAVLYADGPSLPRVSNTGLSPERRHFSLELNSSLFWDAFGRVVCVAGKETEMNENRVSGSLSSDAKAAVQSALETIRQQLPFLIGLDPEARRSLPRMGDKSRAFVRKGLEAANQNPGMLPRAFDLDEFGRDVALDEALLPIAESIRRLAEMVDDTLTAVRSDAYLAALVVYQSAKHAGKNSGLDGALDELGRRFVRKSGGGTPPATPAAR